MGCKTRVATKPLEQAAVAKANAAIGNTMCTTYEQRKKWMDAYLAALPAEKQKEGIGWKCADPKGRTPKEVSEKCPRANIVVRVVNSEGKPVANAEVMIAGPGIHNRVTNADGIVEFENVEPGNYEVNGIHAAIGEDSTSVSASKGTTTPADLSLQEATVREARKHVSSKAWAYDADRPPYPPDTNKCNLFVYETLTKSGKPVPMKERWSWSNMKNVKYPPLAGQWADPSVEIPGWEVVTNPQPGDVAAIAHDYSDASGHVAIVSGPNSSISATGEEVVENDWGFRPGQTPTFRRYVGP